MNFSVLFKFGSLRFFWLDFTMFAATFLFRKMSRLFLVLLLAISCRALFNGDEGEDNNDNNSIFCIFCI